MTFRTIKLWRRKHSRENWPLGYLSLLKPFEKSEHQGFDIDVKTLNTHRYLPVFSKTDSSNYRVDSVLHLFHIIIGAKWLSKEFTNICLFHPDKIDGTIRTLQSVMKIHFHSSRKLSQTISISKPTSREWVNVRTGNGLYYHVAQSSLDDWRRNWG